MLATITIVMSFHELKYAGPIYISKIAREGYETNRSNNSHLTVLIDNDITN
jgi:hypothetical protein